MSRMDRQVSAFCSVSVQSHTVKVRPSVRRSNQKKKKKICYGQTNKHRSDRYYIQWQKKFALNLLNDGNNSWNHTDGRINRTWTQKKMLRNKDKQKTHRKWTSSWQCTYQIPLNAIQCIVTAIQCAMQCNGKCNVAVLIGVWVCVCMCNGTIGVYVIEFDIRL
jgi:hypothetical protein